MAGHFDKSFMTRDPEMARYLTMARAVAKHFLNITVQTIPRDNNEAADRLAKMASSDECPPPKVFYEVLRAPLVTPEDKGLRPKHKGLRSKHKELNPKHKRLLTACSSSIEQTSET